MTAKSDDELPPFSPRVMLAVYVAGAIVTAAILITVWKDELRSLTLTRSKGARSIEGEPGRMWNDVREAVGDAEN